MLRRVLVFVLLVLTATAHAAPSRFDTQPHSNATIEWWYLNAHITTSKGRKLAVVVSFFQTGNGHSPFSPTAVVPRGHYLIYGQTDLQTGKHTAVSAGDPALLNQLQAIAPLMLMQSGGDPILQSFADKLMTGHLPAPHVQFPTDAAVQSQPLKLTYGENDPAFSLVQTSADTLRLRVAVHGESTDLTLRAQRPVMAVGGTGNTGFQHAADMKYFSTTRSTVSGTMGGTERVTGQGWFDHQWGTTLAVDQNGWDWWGLQLANGQDILVFQQRDLRTGKSFHPMATLMMPDGSIKVTHRITFVPSKHWKSDATGVRYPLTWRLSLPDWNLILAVDAPITHQEIPTLIGGSSIWEGTCVVRATAPHRPAVAGVGFMELVGYRAQHAQAPPRTQALWKHPTHHGQH